MPGDSDHLTDLDEVVAALCMSEERHRLLVENAWDVIWTMGVDGAITYVSPSVERVRGLTPEEAAAQTLDQIHPPESAAKVGAYFAELYAAMAAGTTPPIYRGEHEYFRKDGSIMLGALQVIPQCNADGQVVAILGVTRDISAQREYEENLRQARDQALTSEQRFRLAMTSAPIGMAVVDLDRRFVQANPALCGMLGRTEEWLLRHGISDILDDPATSDAHDLAARGMLLSGSEESVTRDDVLRTAAGERVVVTHAIGLLRDDHGTPVSYVSQFVDVTAARRAQERLLYLATHDDMTGLVNRAELLKELSRVLDLASEDNHLVGVLFLDLDGLKGINDRFGHAGGDAVIIEFASRLQALLHGDGIAARIGGDEFVVVLAGLNTLTEAEDVAAGIQQALAAPIEVAGTSVTATVSIGLAPAVPGDTPEQLLARADHVLYEAKQAGRNRTISHERSPESAF